MAYGDLVFKGVLLAACILFLSRVSDIPPPYSGQVGPRVWPEIILWGMVVLLGVSVISQFVQVLRRRPVMEPEGKQPPPEPLFRLANVLAAVLFGAYIIGLDFLGFLVATPLFIIIFLRLMRYRGHPVKGLVIGCAVTLVIAFVFGKMFYLPLPRGMGVFRDFTHLMY